MMDFRMVLIIFTLKQIRLQCAVVNSSSSISTDDLSSNMTSTDSHHRLQRRQTRSGASAVKDEDQRINDMYLKLVKAKAPVEDTYLVTRGEKAYHVSVIGDCQDICLFDSSTQSCENNTLKSSGKDDKNMEVRFLVNQDNFEVLDFKKWTDIGNMEVFQPLLFCDRHYIANDDHGIVFMGTYLFKKPENMKTEVLTRYINIKWEHLKIDNYEVSNENNSTFVEVLKRSIAVNKNCEPAKHQVKHDQGSDKTSSFQTGRTHTFGGGVEASVSGQIPYVFSVGGKVNLKYDHSRQKSEVTTKVDKIMHSVSMEIQVPPNHSCSIDITSTTFTAEVPYTAELTRQYKNNEQRTTTITGIYYHQEMTELQTLVNPCAHLTDGRKCGNE